MPRTRDKLHDDWMSELVAEKGYHSNDTLVTVEEMEIRSYTSEPDRGKRNRKGKGRNATRQYLAGAKVANPNVRPIGLTATSYRTSSGMRRAPSTPRPGRYGVAER